MQAGFVSMNPQVRQLLAEAGVVPTTVEQIAPAMMSRIDAMTFDVHREALMMGQCSGSGIIAGASYGLMSMAEEHTPRTLTTDMVAACLATRQSPDGSWAVTDVRAPLSGNAIMWTALAVRSLEAYPAPGLGRQLPAPIARGRAFPQTVETHDTPEAAVKLLGLVWSNAPSAVIARQA